jgi:hypothetical protein
MDGTAVREQWGNADDAEWHVRNQNRTEALGIKGARDRVDGVIFAMWSAATLGSLSGFSPSQLTRLFSEVLNEYARSI